MKKVLNICTIFLSLLISLGGYSLEYTCTYTDQRNLNLQSTMTFSEATEHRPASFGFIGSDFSMFMLSSPDFKLELINGEFRVSGAVNRGDIEAFQAVLAFTSPKTKYVKAQIWLKKQNISWSPRPNYNYLCIVN